MDRLISSILQQFFTILPCIFHVFIHKIAACIRFLYIFYQRCSALRALFSIITYVNHDNETPYELNH